jgi:hypothetical protein
MSFALLYYRNDLGVITYDSFGFVASEWFDVPITQAELQSLYSHTLQALRHHDTCKLLTVQTHRQPLPEEAQQWIAQQWIPQAIAECAYSHCAIVESAQAAHRAGARAVGQRVGATMTFRFFDNEDEAREWLRTT